MIKVNLDDWTTQINDMIYYPFHIEKNNRDKYVKRMFGLSLRFWYYASIELIKKYNRHIIPKKSGGYRILHEPPPKLKMVQSEIIKPILETMNLPEYIISYKKNVKFQNHIDKHVNKKLVVKADLSNYFTSITYNKFLTALRYIEFDKLFISKMKQTFDFNVMNNYDIYINQLYSFFTRSCMCEDGKINDSTNKLVMYVPQGSPSSPVISNIAFLMYDHQLYDEFKKLNVEYTRYADDIILSTDNNSDEMKTLIRDILVRIIEVEYGYKLNKKKLRFISGDARKKVLGIIVNKIKNPPRYEKKLWRAIKYNINKNGFAAENRKSDFSSVWKFYQYWMGKLNWWSSFNDKYKFDIEELKELKNKYKHEFIKEIY